MIILDTVEVVGSKPPGPTITLGNIRLFCQQTVRGQFMDRRTYKGGCE